MLLAKTTKARIALQGHSGDLNLQERRVLILSDGQRSLNDLVNLLGQGALPSVDRLLRDGYLVGQEKNGATRSVASRASGVFRALQGATPAAPAMPAVTAARAATPASATPVAAPVIAARRSLAATKMYVIDMLQLQRNADSASLAVSVQSSRDPSELVGNVIDALRHIHRSSNASYGRRVADRLAEIIPEEFAPILQAAKAELFATPV